ncbi:S41 family peptidase [Sphingobacterium sp. SGR-19]|uniref:S41 family peptidase n=1 Tax=Sphingobacterium sp. SGR-19 TaxID=2710886 RepID=UPI0013EB29BF|nr:S41 family peptidase [Sphingobacterium sp. SGR-19]NGM64432.1 hypothetical protein [Sphingobacterium sp. SGR-19]
MNLQNYLLVCCLGLLFACKKEIKPPVEPKPEPTEDDFIKGDIYDYFNKYSLWTEQIPDLDEEGRLEFAKKYSSNQSLLAGLKNMTPQYSFQPYQTLDITVGNRYDRYSYLVESGSEGNSSRSHGFWMDTNEGYGIQFGWGVIGDVNYALPVIAFVEVGSPAQKAGVKRGMIVYSVNGEEIKAMLGQSGEVSGADSEKFKRKLEESTLTLKVKTVETLEEEGQDYTMTYSSSYAIDPIVKDSIYKYPEHNKNIGYLAYSSFEEEWRYGHDNQKRMDEVFKSFEDAGIKDLILDIRYNTGGYVDAAIYLANKLINKADDGKLMFYYEVNDYLRPYTEKASGEFDFTPVSFEKKNMLDLTTIYFLVTEQTASAAELLINVLKPYMDVVLIGDANRTYGKPVGFFPEDITDDIQLWVTSFKTVNADEYTDYWNGLAVDEGWIVDYFFLDFGDTRDDMLAKALERAVPTGSSLRASSRKSTSLSLPHALNKGIINKVKERNMLKTKD